jgi:hypothetical protein
MMMAHGKTVIIHTSNLPVAADAMFWLVDHVGRPLTLVERDFLSADLRYYGLDPNVTIWLSRPDDHPDMVRFTEQRGEAAVRV